MISNYNLSCDYHNFELKDKIYLIPDYALKVIYTDGFNEVVFSGNTTNMTILEGHDISFQEESSFDDRFRFSKSVSIKVEGYITFNDLYNRYMAIIETKEGEFYLVNSDFPSFVTHTYSLANGTNSTELVFSSQSNISTLKLTNFSPNNVNSCKQYSNAKIKNVKLTEAWASYLSTWQKSLVNKGEFVDIEPLPDSISLTEEFDGEKYTVTLGFDIPMSYYKNDWHIKLLQFEENKYRGFITLEDGNTAFVGYNVGLFPSYTINGDIISIRLTETAIRGIAYGNDYALVDTDMPNSIEFNGASCYTYNWLSTCDWHVEDKPEYITITPTSGMANTQYELEICNTDDETGYEVSEFIIKVCNAGVRPQVIVKNPIYRYIATTETMCVGGGTKWIAYYSDSHTESAECDDTNTILVNDFEKTNLTGFTIGDCVTTLGSGVFGQCTGLTEITIPSGITYIGGGAFYECTGLTGITCEATTPPQLSDHVFHETYCLIYVPCESVDTYKNNMYWSEYASRIQGIPPCGQPAFEGKYQLTLNNSNIVTAACDSTSSVTQSEIRTQYSGSVVSAEIGDCVTSIGNWAFYGCSGLTSVTIGTGVISIGDGAFQGCKSLTNIDIPYSVTSIGWASFQACSGLTGITIPNSVTSIGNHAFYSCSGLTSVAVLASTPPTLGNYVFDITNNCPIYVPSGSVNTYKSAIGWSIYASRIQAIP